MTVMDKRVLVLNKYWNPINTIPVLKAIGKVFCGRALFVDPESRQTYDFEEWVMEWEEAVSLAKVSADRMMPLGVTHTVIPEIIVCSHYHGPGFRAGARRGVPKFSRRNLFLRDRFTCQYCKRRLPSKDMNMDHVIPKSRGGASEWSNVVLSCVRCNHKKGNQTPSEAGMKLARKPFVPTIDSLRVAPGDRIRMHMGDRTPKTWESFLGKMYWNVEIIPE
jgi:hypothetical protein